MVAFQFDNMEKFAAEKSFLEYLHGYPAQPEWLTAMICGIEQEEQDPIELKRVRQQKELVAQRFKLLFVTMNTVVENVRLFCNKHAA